VNRGCSSAQGNSPRGISSHRGSFDRTSFDVTTEAAEWHGGESTNVRWIKTMSESRSIIATLSGEILEVSATSGCPQRGVLSPLLYSLVVDGLLGELNEEGLYNRICRHCNPN
jgi:hypothetical protein